MTSFVEHSRDKCRNLTPKLSRGRGRELQPPGLRGCSWSLWTSTLAMQLIAHNLHLSKAMKSKQNYRKPLPGLVCLFGGEYPCQEVGGTMSQAACLGSATAAAGAVSWKELEFVCLSLQSHFLEGLGCTSSDGERNSPHSTVRCVGWFCPVVI